MTEFPIREPKHFQAPPHPYTAILLVLVLVLVPVLALVPRLPVGSYNKPVAKVSSSIWVACLRPGSTSTTSLRP